MHHPLYQFINSKLSFLELFPNHHRSRFGRVFFFGAGFAGGRDFTEALLVVLLQEPGARFCDCGRLTLVNILCSPAFSKYANDLRQFTRLIFATSAQQLPLPQPMQHFVASYHPFR